MLSLSPELDMSDQESPVVVIEIPPGLTTEWLEEPQVELQNSHRGQIDITISLPGRPSALPYLRTIRDDESLSPRRRSAARKMMDSICAQTASAIRSKVIKGLSESLTGTMSPDECREVIVATRLPLNELVYDIIEYSHDPEISIAYYPDSKTVDINSDSLMLAYDKIRSKLIAGLDDNVATQINKESSETGRGFQYVSRYPEQTIYSPGQVTMIFDRQYRRPLHGTIHQLVIEEHANASPASEMHWRGYDVIPADTAPEPATV
ncbi:MAG: hypothetical protein WCT32_03500 [Patescibacteria group bacterium]|jgi:hypothetical protein